MNTVQWSDGLCLDFEPMDEIHRAFVALLARAQQANDADLIDAWTEVIAHTADHFAREDAWMQKTRFAGAQPHLLQHRVVLNLLREGLMLAQSGQPNVLRDLAGELSAWFAKHTQSQDAALALHLRNHPVKSGARRGKPQPQVA